MNTNCSIVVSSCDAFEDVWNPFFTLFFRYWPDCPFPIYLIANYKKYDDLRVQTIAVGEDKRWATNMRTALGSIKTEYILYLQEDYLLEKKVDTAKVLKFISYMKEYNAAYVRLVPMPKPDKIYTSKDVGEIDKNAPYRISLQSAFWDKGILFGLLKDGEGGWDMEIKGSERSKEISRLFLSSTKMIIPYFKTTAIKKGRWYYDAVKFCRHEGITLDLSKRKVESRREFYRRKIINNIIDPFKNFVR